MVNLQLCRHNNLETRMYPYIVFVHPVVRPLTAFVHTFAHTSNCNHLAVDTNLNKWLIYTTKKRGRRKTIRWWWWSVWYIQFSYVILVYVRVRVCIATKEIKDKTYAHTSVFTSCVTSLPWFTTYIQLPCLFSAACGCTNWVRVSHNCCRPKAICRLVRLRWFAGKPSVSRTIFVVVVVALTTGVGIDRWNLITACNE